jgi:hypothetical protein
MESIEWLWPGRFARGKIGLIGGMPEEGKSTITIDMVARVTRRKAWPCNQGRAPLGSAIILSAEDDAGDTLVPRLAAAGADLSRVHIIKAAVEQERTRLFSLLQDIERLERKINEVGEVALVIVDPLSAYLGVKKMDSYRTSDVRGALAPLSEMVARTKVSLVGIIHLNKNVGLANAISRFSDSLAFIATARHAYVAVTDANIPERRLFLRAKNNLSARSGSGSQGLAYSTREVEVSDGTITTTAIRIEWEPAPVDMTANEALAAHAATPESATGKAEAVDFLRDYLADGPMGAKVIFKAADEAGLSRKNCRDAREALGIRPRKQATGWIWELPKARPCDGE